MAAIRIRFGSAHTDITIEGSGRADLSGEFLFGPRYMGSPVRPKPNNKLTELASALCSLCGIGPTQMPTLDESVTLAAAMPAKLLAPC